MAKEEIEVELKAKAGNLQQTLEKMQKTLDKLSSGKHEMKLNTNADAIVKSLGNVDKQLKKLSKNNNLNISLSAGDTLARLKNIDDRLKSINKNSKVNLTATTGGTLNIAAQQAEKINKSLCVQGWKLLALSLPLFVPKQYALLWLLKRHISRWAEMR